MTLVSLEETPKGGASREIHLCPGCWRAESEKRRVEREAKYPEDSFQLPVVGFSHWQPAQEQT